MGTGFAFAARQKHFQIGNSDFYADLILYNIKLHAYVVIELKATPFKPESSEGLKKLEDIFHYHRDKKKNREIREKVRDYEKMKGNS